MTTNTKTNKGFCVSKRLFNFISYELNYHPEREVEWSIQFHKGEHPLDIMMELQLSKLYIVLFFLEPRYWFRRKPKKK